ncbi:MAG TPA: neutral/alkaline non-lysosomal ceramidase N-terminal domain-containing protein [Thermoleophilaceae bacterium]|nr:neutral/alkaline non-lysosomal ceramidase N-terminal domain-containing protein [Thermoleophilaceae bacterium]
MGRVSLAFLIAVLGAALAPAGAAAAGLQAGVAQVDASWHVGSGAGQYASTGSFVDQHGFDPSVHSYHFRRSYGLHSRLKVRALVVEGPDGTRAAIVKNDLYIPQDLLYRRTAQILERGDSGITRENFTMAATHNHSSPYYSTPSWGVWTFQDFFDVRFYNYYAERMAEAVEKAAARLRPARVGAAVRQLPDLHRNVPGRATADDGTPAGYPEEWGDHDLIVVRFDDISNPGRPKPLANVVNYALHPEMMEGNDMISADWVGPFERMADRRTGAMTIYTQGAVGNHEPEESRWHEPSERREYYHRNYAQSERAARVLANAVIRTSDDIGRGRARGTGDPDRLVGFETDPEVAMVDRWFPGPISHPLPTVAGCRTDEAMKGDPRVPVANECMGADHNAFDPGVSTDTLQEAGVPVPENLGIPAYTGLEEDLNVHLQALRIGDILLTICSCEQWADQSFNIKSRTNYEQGDEWVGYEWDCVPDGAEVTEAECARARAQVVNDAKGWEEDPFAESEPTDPAEIKGNYTHGELPPERAYRLTVPVGMANDYNGYVVTYREHQRGDHYRKSLNAWGPHASDYMATRLVKLAAQLKGAEAPPREPLEAKVAPDLAHNDARAQVLGTVGKAALESYEATLPSDVDAGKAVEQPEGSITRFDAATFTWNGGSNYVDLPEVRVQRKLGDRWVTHAAQSGEVPLTLQFPALQDAASYLSGQRWPWTAHFEAFVSDIDTGRGRVTPVGTYRFSVRGTYRDNMGRKPYALTSEPFRVEPWNGITVEDLRVEDDGRVSFQVGPRRAWTVAGDGGPEVSGEIGPVDYPDSYEVPRRAEFIRLNRTAFRDRSDPTRITWFCFTCSFRPWLDAGDAHRAWVTVASADGEERRVRARRSDGRWVTRYRLAEGETASVAAGDVVDRWGNYNGAAAG